MNSATLATLDFPSLVELLGRRLQTPLGRRRLAALAPSTDAARIRADLACTTECVAHHAELGRFGLSGLDDPAQAISQLHIEGASLEPKQILILERILAIGTDLRTQIKGEDAHRFPRLSGMTSALPDMRSLLASIKGKILPTGEIDDNASPALARIRRQINGARARIYSSLESLMRHQQAAVQDEIVTIRNGRFVIPVRTDSRGLVPGVMHGLSSSGMTSYVEPLSVIEQNNDIVRLKEQEEVEIAEVLLSISEALRTRMADIRAIESAIAEIDFIQAKARLSVELECVEPAIDHDNPLALSGARHPLLDFSLRQKGGGAVPVNVDIHAPNTSLVISGPNAGGKTVVLKTVGLIAVMAQSGLHVPAAAARVPVFHQIFADIGDQQSIAANLSTFTAHIHNVSEIMAEIAPPSLVLLDEVGTGTDPDEGAALAVSIVDHFKRAGALTIATTHYNKLKVWASQTEGVLNASVELDERKLVPTYRLITGIAGASAGLEIATRAALPPSVVQDARALLEPDQLAAAEYLRKLKLLVDEQVAIRSALEEERAATAHKYAALDLEFARKEAGREAEFQAEVERLVDEFGEKSQEILGQIQDRATAARLRREVESRQQELRRQGGIRLKKQAATAANTGAGPSVGPGRPRTARQPLALREGDRVLVSALGKEGTVDSISGQTYTIAIGSIRYKATADELEIPLTSLSETGDKGTTLSKANAPAADESDAVPRELNVIGSRTDEAVEAVDKFLDRAYLDGAAQVRIIHGHGTGALRRAIRELLSGHPHVEEFAEAPRNQGGAGATIATLKK